MPVTVVNDAGETLSFGTGDELALAAALEKGFHPTGPVGMLLPGTGEVAGFEDPQQLIQAISGGWGITGAGEAARQGAKQDIEETYGGLAGRVQAFGEGGLRGLTFGLLGSGDEADIRRDLFPGTSLVGEGVGLLAGGVGAAETPGFVNTALRYTPAGLTARVARGAGSRLASRVAASAVEGAVEGGFYTLGQNFSDALYHDKPLTIESLASGLGTGVLFGAGIGAGVGLAGKSVARRAALDDLADISAPLSRRISQVDDFATRGAQQVEEALGATIANPLPVLEDAALARRAVEEYHWARRELAKELGDDLSVQLDDLVRREPKVVLNKVVPALNRFEGAARQLEDVAQLGMPQAGDDILAKLANELPEHTRGSALAAHALDAAAIADVAGVPVEDVPVVGPLASAVLKSYAFGRGLGVLASPRAGRILDSVSHEADDLIQRKAQPRTVRGSMGQHLNMNDTSGNLVGAAGKLAGGSGIASRAVRRVLAGPLDNIQAIASKTLRVREQISKTVRRVVREAAKPGRVGPIAGVGVSALENTQLNFERDKEKRNAADQRAAEVRTAMANAATTREKLRERVAPLSTTNVQLGMGLVEHTMAKLQFLLTKLPTNLNYGMDELPMSPAQAAEWGRYVHAANDPMSVLDGIPDGTVSPEEVEALQVLYPSLYREIQMELMDQAAELQMEMPYRTRVTLSGLFEIPLEPTMAPSFVQKTQEAHQMSAQPAQGGGQPIPGVPDLPDEPTKGQRLADR